jgi:hypothetical protein
VKGIEARRIAERQAVKTHDDMLTAMKDHIRQAIA